MNQDRRHHIPRQQHKVTNWPTYKAGLCQRGSLTVWFTDEAIAAWAAAPRTTRVSKPAYSPLAILTALTLRAVFRLAYRHALIGRITQRRFILTQSLDYAVGLGDATARKSRKTQIIRAWIRLSIALAPSVMTQAPVSAAIKAGTGMVGSDYLVLTMFDTFFVGAIVPVSCSTRTRANKSSQSRQSPSPSSNVTLKTHNFLPPWPSVVLVLPPC
jgi:hypothetical protein